MATKQSGRALASVREFLEQWDKHYPPRLQNRRTWDGDIIHAFSGAFGVADLRVSDLRVLVATVEQGQDGAEGNVRQ